MHEKDGSKPEKKTGKDEGIVSGWVEQDEMAAN